MRISGTRVWCSRHTAPLTHEKSDKQRKDPHRFNETLTAEIKLMSQIKITGIFLASLTFGIQGYLPLLNPHYATAIEQTSISAHRHFNHMTGYIFCQEVVKIFNDSKLLQIYDYR